MQEIWKVIPGTEGKYEASDFGRIRCAIPKKDGSKKRPLSPCITNWGYQCAVIFIDGARRMRLVHRLVCLAFNGHIQKGLQVNHKNGIKTDNRLSNLELVTPSQNTKHSYEILGRLPSVVSNPGEKNGRAKITASEVKEIFQLRNSGTPVKQIAEKFGLHKYYVYNLLGGRTWKHIKT